MKPLTNKKEMLDAFTQDQLRTFPLSALREVESQDCRELLAEVGLPVWDQPFLSFPQSTEGELEFIGKWGYYSNLRDEGLLTEENAKWPVLAYFEPNAVLLNPRRGSVHYLRPDYSEFYLLNSSLDAYIYFLRTLKVAAPTSPADDFADLLDLNLEGVRSSLQAQWKASDSVALSRRSSLWYEILLHLHDPDAHHFDDAESYPYPYFDDDIIRAFEKAD